MSTASASRGWTCQRQAAGKRCGHFNPSIKRNCQACGKRRPARKRPAHLTVLAEMPYEEWVERFGETCGICGCGPSENRRLDRDHDHATGEARGLLCHRCNRGLPNHVTLEWLERARAYLERSDGGSRLAA